ncbi:MAG: hypothetical protein GWM98_13225 [Nitrospinaceae bacterium]|nr:hypothetical protein [Nitrospinaceae bacterium]NIR55252.1 hypothetical protein [Nitrospinaceae bacterium]NIS85690.1 hypothetical protein [Nitrospinaceae bacterium]NIT82541.1 hypothetical protein [Nitrospinaceae bacterium]NIU44745.1 hypothetical protein [Nitrospinaceae bacterium]
MKSWIAMLAVLTALGASYPREVQAREWEGMSLAQYCTGDAFLFDETVCRAYLQGVIDTHQYFKLQGKHPKAFCVPDTEAERARREKWITRWLDDFQNRIEEPPIDLVIDFLGAVFRCSPPPQ